MLHERSYMYPPPQEYRSSDQPSMVKILLITTVGVFILQHILKVSFPGINANEPRFLWDWLALSKDSIQELKIWTLVSYGFLHNTDGLFHILGNMLGLYFIGRIIEPLIGPKPFLFLYLWGSVTGGLIYLLFHFQNSPHMVPNGVPVLGASASVMALLSFFCSLYPERPITLFLFLILPITLKPKWVLRITLGLSIGGLLVYELSHRGNIAHSAHLGGLFTGVLYYHFFHHSSKQPFKLIRSNRPSIELPDWIRRKRPASHKIDYKVNRFYGDKGQKEIDRILDKINADGFGSLTKNEKKTLNRAKDTFKR